MSLDTLAIAVPAILSLLAIGVSIAALHVSRQQHHVQLENTAHIENSAALGSLFLLLDAHPDTLRFHGLTEADLRCRGLTPADLAYLVASFEAASHYYEYLDNSDGPFPRNSLRYGMCAAEATRNAWPLVKPFLAATPRYVRRIEATLAHHARLQRRRAGKACRAPSPAPSRSP